MLLIENVNQNHVMTLTVRDKLSKEDYEAALPELKEALENEGELRFFIRLEDFSGFTAGAFWEDLKLDFKHGNEYGKTAIVGDSKWEQWGTEIAGLFFDADMRYFDESESVQAWRWVNN
jgi:hypothetical protein